jgi:hypothetical protein
MLSLEQWQWEIAHAEELQELIREALAGNNTELVETALRDLNRTQNQIVFHSQAVEQNKFNQQVNLK